MSDSEDFIDTLHLTDPWIAAITSKRIEAALQGFPLPLAEGWNFERLNRSIQDTVDCARGVPPQGNADAIAELTKLAAKATALRESILQMGGTAGFSVFWEVLWHSKQTRGVKRIDDNDYNAVLLDPLDLIGNILARAASQTGLERTQAARWREKDEQNRRVNFAVALIPIFSSAFNTPARAHNWGADYGKEHPWPDFYLRIYRELFPEAEHLNLPKVLQEAAREHRSVGTSFQAFEE